MFYGQLNNIYVYLLGVFGVSEKVLIHKLFFMNENNEAEWVFSFFKFSTFPQNHKPQFFSMVIMAIL